MAAEVLKEKAREELKRLTEKEIGSDFGSLGNKPISIAATKFFIREIHNPTKTTISEEDIVDGVVDGKDDLGCDFIHRDDGNVTIIQAKHRKLGTQEGDPDIAYFKQVLVRLRNSKIKANKYIQDKIDDIDWANDHFDLYYISFANFSPRAREIVEQKPQYPDDVQDLDDRCNWNFFDETDLNEEMRGARNLTRGISPKTIKMYPVGDKGSKGSTIIETDAGEYKSYLTVVPARQVIKAYEELGKDAIFSLNIRNFIGNTSTNKNIIDAATNEATHFFLFNNGISCVASKVKPTDEHLELTGLQVINGAQTVKALVNAARKNKNKGEFWVSAQPNILVRITEMPDQQYGPSARVREKVIQRNNTQNVIKISDFRSNDDVQVNLKEQFAEINRRGKQVAYLPKRTDKIPNSTEVVRLEEFAKSVFAFLYNPTAFSGSTSFLFNTDPEGGYLRVFGDGTHQWTRIPDEEFKVRAAIYWLTQEFARHLKETRDSESDPDNRAALERKWFLVFAARVVFQGAYGVSGWKPQLAKLYKGDWRIGDPADKKGEVVKRIYNASKSGVIMAYKNSKSLQKETFVHRNWMRSKNTPVEIESLLKDVLLPNSPPIPPMPA